MKTTIKIGIILVTFLLSYKGTFAQEPTDRSLFTSILKIDMDVLNPEGCYINVDAVHYSEDPSFYFLTFKKSELTAQKEFEMYFGKELEEFSMVIKKNQLSEHAFNRENAQSSVNIDVNIVANGHNYEIHPSGISDNGRVKFAIPVPYSSIGINKQQGNFILVFDMILL